MNTIDPRISALILSRATGRAAAKGKAHILRGISLSNPTLLIELVPELCPLFERSGQLREAASAIEKWQSEGIIPVSLQCPAYPRRLRNHPNAPLLLYLRGNRPLEALGSIDEIPTVAIVGSRSASPQGCELASQIAAGLRRYGVCIISGLALGIDAAAHGGALQSINSEECSTIAVLGNGLHQVYPASHHRLARRLIDAGGVLLSAYEPGTPPLPHHFLERNGIIAHLSRGVVVVQAAPRSGALSTARWALDAGAEVMAVPGSVGDTRHIGTHDLIRDGAHLVTSAEDIASILGLTHQKEPLTIPSAPSPLGKMFAKSGGTLPRHQILAPNGPLTEAELITLEIQGTLTSLPGDLIRIN